MTLSKLPEPAARQGSPRYLISRWCVIAVAWCLLLWLPAARAALPTAGEVLEGSIVLSPDTRIPLPAGRWRVEVRYLLRGKSTTPKGDFERPVPDSENLVLKSINPKADMVVLVLEFTMSASGIWSHQPCEDEERSSQLWSNAFNTGNTSTVIKCNRLFLYENFRNAVKQAQSSKKKWFVRNFGPIAEQYQDVPVNSIVVQGYMSRMNADYLRYSIYTNPALRGLDENSGGTPESRVREQAAVNAYIKTLQAWSNAYTEVLEKNFLMREGSGAIKVPVLKFTSPTTSIRPAGK